MGPDIEAIHQSVHDEYQERLKVAEWDAAVQRATVLDRDRTIAELTAILETATDPGE